MVNVVKGMEYLVGVSIIVEGIVVGMFGMFICVIIVCEVDELLLVDEGDIE